MEDYIEGEELEDEKYNYKIEAEKVKKNKKIIQIVKVVAIHFAMSVYLNQNVHLDVKKNLLSQFQWELGIY